ncbi:hypothetical protein [Pedobacter borealis]|uniref:hypothetical protein n=1 Tax=Pedobacter borealis TaxID=475254 RepID=UPI000691462F|nr:hypothetical protein [Pedobacter borealis]
MLANVSQNISCGKITVGLEPDQTVKSVIEFLELNFKEFGNKVRGEVTANEKALTDKLCKFLNRNAFATPFFFHHENVEDFRTGASAQIDIATLAKSENITVGDRIFGEFDSFFSIEAKRLPTPGSGREKEYVIGTNKSSGGVERFKKGIHGKYLKYAAIIGYIQNENAEHWFITINNWISDLIASTPNFWRDEDKLNKENSTNINKFTSKNFRKSFNGSDDFVHLYHFWVDLLEPNENFKANS